MLKGNSMKSLCRLVALSAAILFGYNGYSQSVSSTPEPSPYRFHRIQIGGGGFISGVLFHPTVSGLAYVRTDIGGAYRRESSGAWVPLQDWVSSADANLLGVESMAVDATHPNDLYLAVGTYVHPGVPNGALLISHNRGDSFQRVPLPFQLGGNEPARLAGERLAIDPSHSGTLYLGTRSHGLWRSRDYGQTWAAVAGFTAKGQPGVGVMFVLPGVDSQGHAMVYAGVGGVGPTLYRSTDDGEHWSALAGGPSGFPYHAAFGNDGSLDLTYGNAPGPNDVTEGSVFRLSPEGSWSNINPPAIADAAQHYGYAGLSVDASHPKTMLVATLDRWHPGDTIFRSHDSGKHWVSLREKAVNDSTTTPFLKDKNGRTGFGHWIGTVAIDPFQPGHILYGTGATLWETHDLLEADHNRPTHWLPATQGIEETAVLSLVRPTSTSALFIGLGDIGCFRADDVATGHEATTLTAIPFSNCDSIAVAERRTSVMAAVGRTWGTSAAHGGYSIDGGHTWSLFATEPEGAAEGGTVAVSAEGDNILWVTHTGNAFSTRDMGKSWHALPTQHVVHAVAQGDFGFILLDSSNAVHRFDTRTKEISGKVTLPDELMRARQLAVFGEDVWLFGDGGLWRLTDLQPQKLAAVEAAYAISFGRGETAGSPKTIFLSGRIAGRTGIFRSLDAGLSWHPVDDEAHHFGWVGVLAGDPQVFGRVFLGTNGLGVIVAEPLPVTSETTRR